MSGFKEYDQYDGLGLAELVQKKEVKPAELVEEAINRIENHNPKINAVIYKMYDSARKSAEGKLPHGIFRGVPFLLKDIMAMYAGVPMRGGSRFYENFVPNHDSEIVRRLKATGIIIIGKTNTPEFGLVPVTEPELFGPSNNPWDLSRTTGGSSGGSAAAVAARIVPLAHGNDGGGSIRIPASCCGVFGLKPTRGRNPLGPDVGEVWHGLAIDHVLSLSVRDSAAMLDATAGPDIGAPYYAPPPTRPFVKEVGSPPGKLRIAFTTEPFLGDFVHEDCIKGLEETVKLCKNLGHEMVEAAPKIDGKAFAEAFFTLVCGETRAEIEEASVLFGRKARSRDFETATWLTGLLGKTTNASEFSKALRLLKKNGRIIGQFFVNYDILLTPTLAMPPGVTGFLGPKHFEALAMKLMSRLNAGMALNAVGGIEKSVKKIFNFMPYTPLANASGQPAMSVPLYWNADGLPIGIQFMGRYCEEATLFRLAAQLEKAQPWFYRRPPICG